jgi:RNA polymerase sigma-70 factor (ECF subfamily)
VTQHAWTDFVADRRGEPESLPGFLEAIDASSDARADLERELEQALHRELLEVAMHRVEKRVKSTNWGAFHLTAIMGLSGADAARRLRIPVASVFVARHRVQKLIQEEVRTLRPDEP